jgi:hypothetical protein
MALVRYAEGQQRSGSMGGSVYSHNRYGQYLRTRSIPVNPSTDRQVLARNRVQALTIRWGTILTQDQRDDWDNYGAAVPWKNRLGDDCHLTGLAHYVRSNSSRMQCNLAILDDAPVILDVAAAEQSLAVVASEAAQTLSVAFDDTAPWCSEDGGYQSIFMGLPQDPSIKYFGSPYRHVSCLLGNSLTPITSPQVILAVFTPWPFNADQRLWVRTRIGRADGRLSHYAQTNFLAVA